jgi:hypothetical protein
VGELTTDTAGGSVTALQYSPHAAAKQLLGTACHTGSVFVWDTTQRALRSQVSPPSPVQAEASLHVASLGRLFSRVAAPPPAGSPPG